MLRSGQARAQGTRAGFTLVEILLVISILLTLLSLALSSVLKGMQFIRKVNTERTMQKIDARFNDRFEALHREAQSAENIASFTYLPIGGNPTDPFSLAGGSTDRERRRARVIFLKYLYRWSFPMTYQEIQMNASSGYPFAARLAQMLGSQLKTPANTNSKGHFTESAACLALIYQALGSADDLTPNEIMDTDDDGVREIVDAYGRPLLFYRWAYHNSNVVLGVPKNGTDNEDPEGMLDLIWQTGAVQEVAIFTALFHPPVRTVGPNPAFYSPFTIASAGQDGLTGLRLANYGYPNAPLIVPAGAGMEILDPVNQTYVHDNLYSFRSRLGVTGQ